MGIKCKQYLFIQKDARSFTITGNIEDIDPVKVEDKIVALNFENYSLSIGDTTPVNKVPYKINSISLTSKADSYELSSAKLNKSSLFILPMLGGTRNLFMFDSLFVNAFIEINEYNNCICLLYRFSGDPLFLKFEQALKQFRTFKDTFDPSPHFVTFVFDIPTKYEEDYANYIAGKYSKFSPEFKSKIMEFHSFNIYGEMAQILFQDENRRKRLEEDLGVELPKGSELFSIIDKEEETFNPKIYI